MNFYYNTQMGVCAEENWVLTFHIVYDIISTESEVKQ
jgi:hypothetical protein